MSPEHIIETDVLVIGGGIAGLFAAIKAKEQGSEVILVDKGYAGRSGATYGAVSWYMVHSSEWGHKIDTVVNQVQADLEYICNPEWTQVCAEDSWDRYQDLVSWGVKFPVGEEERKDFFRKQIVRGRNEKSISAQNTFLSTKQDEMFTSIPIRRNIIGTALRNQLVKLGVKIIDKTMVTDLLKSDGKVAGAVAFSYVTDELYIFKAKAVALCGGWNSFRPPGRLVEILTGDADAMAYRIGAEITGKEFPETHFTVGKYPAVYTRGGIHSSHFIDGAGEPVQTRGTPLNMAFAIHQGRGPVIWDFDAATPEEIAATEAYEWKSDTGYRHKKTGIELDRGGKYPLVGGASGGQSRGGIWSVNKECESSVPCLYSGGDCNCTYGEIRGGGWGLTYASVTGARAGRYAAEYALKANQVKINEEDIKRAKEVLSAPIERKGGLSPRWVTQLLQNTMMPYYVSLIKNEKRMQAALTMVEFMRDDLVPKLAAKDGHELRFAHETKNMVLNAEMMLKSSLFRTESRHTHYRQDYPRRDDPAWLAWVKYKEENGEMKMWKEPVPQKWWPDESKSYEEKYPNRYPGEKTD